MGGVGVALGVVQDFLVSPILSSGHLGEPLSLLSRQAALASGGDPTGVDGVPVWHPRC
jgi:hypothetical protein